MLTHDEYNEMVEPLRTVQNALESIARIDPTLADAVRTGVRARFDELATTLANIATLADIADKSEARYAAGNIWQALGRYRYGDKTDGLLRLDWELDRIRAKLAEADEAEAQAADEAASEPSPSARGLTLVSGVDDPRN